MPYRDDIPGQVSTFQLRAIELVASLVPPHGAAMEVGSLFGRSSYAWASSVDPTVEVFCIDPWEGNEGVRSLEARHGISYGIDQFKAFTADCANIRPLKGYSPANFRDWERPIDLYYEDAVHTDPILSQNLDFWTAKVKPTGVVCGDDYRPRFPDVRAGAHRLAERLGRDLVRVDYFWCLLPSADLVPAAASVARKLAAIAAESDAAKRSRGFVLSIGPRRFAGKVAQGQSPRLEVRLSNESLDPWPPAPDSDLTLALRISPDDHPRRPIAEFRQSLGRPRLEPDIPHDVQVLLPSGTLPPGRYVAVFDVLDPLAQPASGRDFETASGVPFLVTDAADATAAAAAAAGSSGTRRSLVDAEVVQNDFTSLAFADSHGAFAGHLGAGGLYYALSQTVRAQVAVCIGSGGGFVASLLRRAQIDAGITPACTYLIDANLPDLAFGSPLQAAGWLSRESPFRDRESDVVVLPMLSADAARLLTRHGITIDHLHIDGDHSKDGVLADFDDYAPLVSRGGVVTLHDLRMPSVKSALKDIAAAHPDWEILTFPEIGAGTVVMRRRQPGDVARRPQAERDFVDRSRRVALDVSTERDAIATSRENARFQRWKYLTTTPYRLRYDLIAKHLDGGVPTLVEIGGYPNSVLNAFTSMKTLHAIEPYAPEGFVAELGAVAKAAGVGFFLHRGGLGEVALPWRDLGPYDLIALGLDPSAAIDSEDGAIAALAALLEGIAGARRVGVEFPRIAAADIIWELLRDVVAPIALLDIEIDLTKDPVADQYHVKDNRGVRHLMVFEPRRELDLGGMLVRNRVAEAGAAIWALKTKAESPVEAAYRLGTPVVFTTEGNAGPYKRHGWVGAEKRHTWTQGPESRLILHLDAPPEEIVAAPDYLLSIALRPFVVPGKIDTQSLTVKVNGHQVHASRLGAATTLVIDVPTEIVTAETPLRIDFVHPNYTVPAEVIPGNKDRKPLAFAVSSLTFAATGDATRPR